MKHFELNIGLCDRGFAVTYGSSKFTPMCQWDNACHACSTGCYVVMHQYCIDLTTAEVYQFTTAESQLAPANLMNAHTCQEWNDCSQLQSYRRYESHKGQPVMIELLTHEDGGGISAPHKARALADRCTEDLDSQDLEQQQWRKVVPVLQYGIYIPKALVEHLWVLQSHETRH